MTTKPTTGHAFTHEWLPLDTLQPHPDIQRSFVRAHAEAIAAQFDPDAFGELYVIKNGTAYLIWDGQHRAWAARKALGDDQLVYCRVYRDKDIATLAGRSLKLNTQKGWSPIDRFRLRVKAGEWRARTIHGTLYNFGLRIGSGTEEGTVGAVVACDWIMEKAGGQGGLERVMRILCHAWGRDPSAYHNGLLRGVALVCTRYGSKVDDKALSEKLAKSGGPSRFIGRARDRAKMDAVTVPNAVAELIVNEYNKAKRGATRLPKWAV